MSFKHRGGYRTFQSIVTACIMQQDNLKFNPTVPTEFIIVAEQGGA